MEPPSNNEINKQLYCVSDISQLEPTLDLDDSTNFESLFSDLTDIPHGEEIYIFGADEEEQQWVLVQKSILPNYCKQHVLKINHIGLLPSDTEIIYSAEDFSEAVSFLNELKSKIYSKMKSVYGNVWNMLPENNYVILQILSPEPAVIYKCIQKKELKKRYQLVFIQHPNYGFLYQMYDALKTQELFAHILCHDEQEYLMHNWIIQLYAMSSCMIHFENEGSDNSDVEEEILGDYDDDFPDDIPEEPIDRDLRNHEIRVALEDEAEVMSRSDKLGAIQNLIIMLSKPVGDSTKELP